MEETAGLKESDFRKRPAYNQGIVAGIILHSFEVSQGGPLTQEVFLQLVSHYYNPIIGNRHRRLLIRELTPTVLSIVQPAKNGAITHPQSNNKKNSMTDSIASRKIVHDLKDQTAKAIGIFRDPSSSEKASFENLFAMLHLISARDHFQLVKKSGRSRSKQDSMQYKQDPFSSYFVHYIIEGVRVNNPVVDMVLGDLQATFVELLLQRSVMYLLPDQRTVSKDDPLLHFSSRLSEVLDVYNANHRDEGRIDTSILPAINRKAKRARRSMLD